ncbi:MAG: hypothetical protein KTR22_06480 [Flavobacteriaceae bacterium]|nr:hypothetical protein [Flavobacteriaceae bacterium]
MKNKEVLKRAILRSQEAYRIYVNAPSYLQALRIYNANEIIYDCLYEHYADPSNGEAEDLLTYIFHLEDWFHQFQEHEKENQPKLTDTFQFERHKDAIPFPKELINHLIA